jgi:hypothetical protein
MSVQTTTYDVFLCYSLTEAETAELVERSLTQAGLDVFDPRNLEAGSRIDDVLWHAVAKSATLVVIVDPQVAPNANVALELGAAMAWHKPIYVVHADGGTAKLPSYLREFPAYPVSRLGDIAQSVKRGLTTLSDEERSILSSVYTELGIPVDKLLAKPAHVDALGRAFNSRCRKGASGERLVQELLRLRKAGQLPRLGR